MSLPVLTQVYDDVRRLAIAGSVVASGDFRLKKLIPPLEQSGQKAPVFAKVAQSVTKLVESTEKTSSEALLELSTLVNAILYTQGETGLAGELAPIETTDLGQQQTQASARVLKPLLEALSSTGSGRMEIIKDAHERGAFRDLRLVKPALAALDDPYPEIGDFVAANVLPLYGKAILPGLKAKFDQKGRAGHVRRLALMHRLDPEGTRQIVKTALEEGSKEVKVAAIECLGGEPEDLAFLLEQAKAKAKDVREAALKALGKADGSDAVAALREALQGGDIDLAIEPVRESRNPQLRKFVLEEAETLFQSLIAAKEKDKKEAGKRISRMLSLLECLRGRNDEETGKFLIGAFTQREKLAAIKAEPSGKDVQQRLVQIMAAGPKEAQTALIGAHGSLDPDDLAQAFDAARRSRDPVQVFEMFSPYLAAKGDEKKKGRDAVSAKRQAIAASLTFGSQAWYHDHNPENVHTQAIRNLDPRWLDLAVAQQDLEIVQALARPNHAAANKLLGECFEQRLKKSKDPWQCGQILHTMVRIKHPAATDAAIAAITKLAKDTHSYGLYWVGQVIPSLPKDALPKLEALLPTLPEKAIDQLLDYVTQLKNKP
ncbi:MAG TPA: HEAT repeat domain-containing protein [Pirellulaceae bacterium]|nr:HEAT repeat domain-containing protein [Pirellulaceae bacterium]